MILIAASLLTLAMACTFIQEPTPRPTYTPYPTYTPVPLVLSTVSAPPTPVALQTTDRTQVPLLELGTTSSLPKPTVSPEMVIFRNMEDGERFSDETYEVIKQAEQSLSQGRHQDALEKYFEAQRIHGEPSWVIQNWIGITYVSLGNREAALQHYTNAIEIEDSPTNRTNRGTSYLKTGKCEPAIRDAKAALAMEATNENRFNSDVQANSILAGCYGQQGKYLLALQHADAALQIARENDHTGRELEAISGTRDAIQSVLDGREWTEDLLFEPALTHIRSANKLLENGMYTEAITSFETAQKLHSKPSGAIQTKIGHAYSDLGQHEKAIQHYSAAVEIRDAPLHRVDRAWEYASNGRCEEAITDAEAALGMKPYSEPGYHTSAEAHWILAACSPGEQTQAHMDQAAEIARDHGYTEEDIVAISGIVSGNSTSEPPPESQTPETKQYSSAPAMTIDPNRKYTAVIDTNRGEMEIALHSSETPVTVNNFIFLAREGFYDGVSFHRIIQGFMAQTGDPTGTGAGGPGYQFDDEPVSRNYTKGTVAMANAGPNTNGSQFFIVHADDAGLPPNYTIFGEVILGLNTLDAIASTPVRAGRSREVSVPTEAVVIESILIQETN